MHPDGVMRRATAADEILPLKIPRVQANTGYLVVILLLAGFPGGTVGALNPNVIEGCFRRSSVPAPDFLIQPIVKDLGRGGKKITCPHCQRKFEVTEPATGRDLVLRLPPETQATFGAARLSGLTTSQLVVRNRIE